MQIRVAITLLLWGTFCFLCCYLVIKTLYWRDFSDRRYGVVLLGGRASEWTTNMESHTQPSGKIVVLINNTLPGQLQLLIVLVSTNLVHVHNEFA